MSEWKCPPALEESKEYGDISEYEIDEVKEAELKLQPFDYGQPPLSDSDLEYRGTTLIDK